LVGVWVVGGGGGLLPRCVDKISLPCSVEVRMIGARNTFMARTWRALPFVSNFRFPALLQNSEKRKFIFVMCVLVSAWNNSAPTGRILYEI